MLLLLDSFIYAVHRDRLCLGGRSCEWTAYNVQDCFGSRNHPGRDQFQVDTARAQAQFVFTYFVFVYVFLTST